MYFSIIAAIKAAAESTMYPALGSLALIIVFITLVRKIGYGTARELITKANETQDQDAVKAAIRTYRITNMLSILLAGAFFVYAERISLIKSVIDGLALSSLSLQGRGLDFAGNHLGVEFIATLGVAIAIYLAAMRLKEVSRIKMAIIGFVLYVLALIFSPLAGALDFIVRAIDWIVGGLDTFLQRPGAFADIATAIIVVMFIRWLGGVISKRFSGGHGLVGRITTLAVAFAIIGVVFVVADTPRFRTIFSQLGRGVVNVGDTSLNVPYASITLWLLVLLGVGIYLFMRVQKGLMIQNEMAVFIALMIYAFSLSGAGWATSLMTLSVDFLHGWMSVLNGGLSG